MSALGSMATGSKRLVIIIIIIFIIVVVVIAVVITTVILLLLLWGQRDLGLGMTEGVGSSSM